MMVKGNPGAVVSGRFFVSEDTTDSDASAIDIYSDPRNYASATASIMKCSEVTTSSRPSEQDVTSKSGYSVFQQKRHLSWL
ncbi:hypothetical protein BG003_009913 [Podila horticola]|nr:hypothetical protein BG003_009913 [Podila horticola]